VSRRGVRVPLHPGLRTRWGRLREDRRGARLRGDRRLSLKPWLADNVVRFRRSWPCRSPALPPTIARSPHHKEVGAHTWQNMADRSGASRIARKTQLAELHGQTVLDLSQRLLEENAYFASPRSCPARRSWRGGMPS